MKKKKSYITGLFEGEWEGGEGGWEGKGIGVPRWEYQKGHDCIFSKYIYILIKVKEKRFEKKN